jgi:hypothetical protein
LGKAGPSNDAAAAHKAKAFVVG